VSAANSITALKADIVSCITCVGRVSFDRADYVDSFGRSRRCLRKDLPDMIGSDQKVSNATK